MIDLHIHSSNSGAQKSPIEILKIAEEKELDIISITDHDTIQFYNEINYNPKIFFSGKLIAGCEINCICGDEVVEVMAYNFDLKKFNETIKLLSRNERWKIVIEKALTLLNEYNINVNFTKADWEAKSLSKTLYLKILENNEWTKQINCINPSYLVSRDNFVRKALLNKNSPLFVDLSDYLYDISEISNLIKSCNGKVFLAHPARYSLDIESALEYMQNIVDGIEVYHPSASKNDILLMESLCEKYKFLKSGGSDFHKENNNSENYKNIGEQIVKRDDRWLN